MQLPGGQPLGSSHQLTAAGGPATASSSQQNADSAKQRKQYGSSGKPVLRPSIGKFYHINVVLTSPKYLTNMFIFCYLL